MKKTLFILLCLLFVFTSCSYKIVKVNNEEKTQQKQQKQLELKVKRQKELETFVNMRIGDRMETDYHIFNTPRKSLTMWSYSDSLVTRIYGGWIITYDLGYDDAMLFIPYDDFMKEYNISREE